MSDRDVCAYHRMKVERDSLAAERKREFFEDFRRRWGKWEGRERDPARLMAYAEGLYQTLGWLADELEARRVA